MAGGFQMKITKCVDLNIEHEVEIEITADEISECFRTDSDGVNAVLRSLNSIAAFMKAIPDEVISEIKDGGKQAIRKFFIEQAERYTEGKDSK
jgi:hypothetical protein